MSFDQSYFYSLVKDILTTPSPSGYTHHVIEKIAQYSNELGLSYHKTNKGNLIIEFPGIHSNQTLALAAHVDTLGLMVRSINHDGTLNLTSIGGNQMMTLQGEYCQIHTRNNTTYTGTILSTTPSAHVYQEYQIERLTLLLLNVLRFQSYQQKLCLAVPRTVGKLCRYRKRIVRCRLGIAVIEIVDKLLDTNRVGVDIAALLNHSTHVGI